MHTACPSFTALHYTINHKLKYLLYIYILHIPDDVYLPNNMKKPNALLTPNPFWLVGRGSGSGPPPLSAKEAYAARWDLSPYPTPRPIPIIPRQATAEDYSCPPPARPLIPQTSLPAHMTPPNKGGTVEETAVMKASPRPLVVSAVKPPSSTASSVAPHSLHVGNCKQQSLS